MVTVFFVQFLFSGNDHREAKILISIVVVFVVCQSFTIVADIYEVVTCSYENMKLAMCSSTDHIENIIDIAHFMLSFNSSINFLLYAIHDKMFRDAFVKVNMHYNHNQKGSDNIYIFISITWSTSYHVPRQYLLIFGVTFSALQTFDCGGCITRILALFHNTPSASLPKNNPAENQPMIELQVV